jgi:hypothetical protein
MFCGLEKSGIFVGVKRKGYENYGNNNTGNMASD